MGDFLINYQFDLWFKIYRTDTIAPLSLYSLAFTKTKEYNNRERKWQSAMANNVADSHTNNRAAVQATNDDASASKLYVIHIFHFITTSPLFSFL